MKFDEAVRTVLGKYATFQGRASRSEYWYWVLFVFAVSVAINIGAQIVSPLEALSAIFSLAVIVPHLAVAVRRLHDSGRSGWNLLWSLIPLLGGLYVLYRLVQPSQPGANAYGPQPMHGAG